MSEICVDNPRSLPAVVDFLLKDHVHYTTLTVVAFAVMGCYLRSFLPGPQLLLLERTLEEAEEILLDAQENDPFRETQFVIENQLQLNRLRLEISDLRLQNFLITSIWGELWAFCKGNSFRIQNCKKRAIDLKIQIKANTEHKNRHFIEADIDKLESMLSKDSDPDSDAIARPLPCVLSTTMDFRGHTLSALPILSTITFGHS